MNDCLLKSVSEKASRKQKKKEWNSLRTKTRLPPGKKDSPQEQIMKEKGENARVVEKCLTTNLRTSTNAKFMKKSTYFAAKNAHGQDHATSIRAKNKPSLIFSLSV